MTVVITEGEHPTVEKVGYDAIPLYVVQQFAEDGDPDAAAWLKTQGALTAAFGYAFEYNPDQPRVPAGSPEGGQFGGDGSGGGSSASGPHEVDVTPQERSQVEQEAHPFWPKEELPNEAAWRAILTDEAKALDDPQQVYPDRYKANAVSGYTLKEGEIETRVYKQLDGGPPRLVDITTLAKGTSVSDYLESHPDEKFFPGSISPPLVKVDGSERPPEHVYRVMDAREYDAAQKNGYIKSDERMNLGSTEGTVTSLRSTGTFYAPLDGSPYRIARIDYRDADGWRIDPADGYVKTDARVPFDRISAVTPPIEGRSDVRPSATASGNMAEFLYAFEDDQ